MKVNSPRGPIDPRKYGGWLGDCPQVDYEHGHINYFTYKWRQLSMFIEKHTTN